MAAANKFAHRGWMMNRMLTPELLDFLPADDAEAVRSRRDLVRINRILRNAAWWRNTVAPEIAPADRVLEVGPGDGSTPLIDGFTVDGLDRFPRPSHWPREAGWHCLSAQSFCGWEDYDVIVGNLVFHHFCPRELRELGNRMARRARIIAACEPRRGRRFQIGFGMIARAIGLGRVTRHDGHVSIAAGFRDEELPHALGLDRSAWELRVTQSATGAYRMLALRRP